MSCWRVDFRDRQSRPLPCLAKALCVRINRGLIAENVAVKVTARAKDDICGKASGRVNF
jgi:hypothetical protein